MIELFLDNFKGDNTLYTFADIHCHTLYNVDDGAHNDSVMKNMLDTAYLDGIRTICFTPHFKMYEFRNKEKILSYNSKIQNSFQYALDYAKEKYPDMTLFLGNEIMYHSDIFDSLEKEYCCTLNNSSYLLLEFQPTTSSHELLNSVSRVLRRGLIPIIAHVERYGCLIKKPDIVKELKDMGAVIQVNCSSVLCFKLSKRGKFIKYVLKNRLVDVIASDAHNDSAFPQRLSKSNKYISKHFGSKYAEKIFHTNQIAILDDKKIF